MPDTPCHILVEHNPALIYASRNGSPNKVLPRLNRFLETFWQERDTAGSIGETPECLVAQVVVRFGFEICEDDFSNLRVGIHFHADVDYLYWLGVDSRQVQVWVPEATYRSDPSLGLQGCRELLGEGKLAPIPIAPPRSSSNRPIAR